ncbi:cytochrome b [Erwinia tasmaniensis]|uniref:Cytochrome b561-like protein n=1 Tax=Erwinia tasmaniensis (strain DSM 17950 / CFBP 7177 / CIP 109463 / NCPPB 4357 / Et1/99) TaxID=465817 RepID=B2VDJ4_ERWT9|nr:cytochrome b [Erwinia tasmaniensis]CAO97103.1 Cytochrome b561-like protein [Erwinia tasmaniensis Et1/99]
MRWKNSVTRYGALSIGMHWLVAVAVYGMFALGLWMVTQGYYDEWYHKAPELHKSIGMVLFAVMLVRVVWRFVSPPPKPLKSYSPLVRHGAVIAHLLLYGLLFAILISGYLISTAEGKPVDVFGVLPVPALFTGLGEQADLAGNIHLWLAWSVVILSVLHGLAALKHHFIDRDITLKRMLGHRID